VDDTFLQLLDVGHPGAARPVHGFTRIDHGEEPPLHRVVAGCSGWWSMRLRGIGSDRPGRGSTATSDRPFVEELRAVEKLLPIPPDEINRRVLGSHLGEADLEAAERLNAMNLRYYEEVVRPLLDEWTHEVRARRAGQAWSFVAACAALVSGAFLHGTAAYVLFFVGTFGVCTAIAAWFGHTAASTGARLASKIERNVTSSREGRT
jgi:hypothetical protein